ncbi:hypothetical protein GOV04_03415 [Candidatus Woesearchaeota archaeon]|nr:hypothetical protein [Candidatus Woesearchaeota archaeon]
MKVLAFVDLHDSLEDFKKVQAKAKKADIIINVGDFTWFEAYLEKWGARFEKLNKTMLVVHGNHESIESIEHLAKKHKNIVNIHNKAFEIDDVVFIGYGGGGFAMHDEQFEKDMKKFEKYYKKNKKVVLIVHGPPYGTKLDDLGEHVGCHSRRKYIETHDIELFITGHLHEHFGTMDKIGKVLVVNVGPTGKVFKI